MNAKQTLEYVGNNLIKLTIEIEDKDIRIHNIRNLQKMLTKTYIELKEPYEQSYSKVLQRELNKVYYSILDE